MNMYVVYITLELFVILLFSGVLVKISIPHNIEKGILVIFIIIYCLLVVYRPEGTPDYAGYANAYNHLIKYPPHFDWEMIKQYGLFSKAMHGSHMEWGFLLLYSFFIRVGAGFYAASFLIYLAEILAIFFWGKKILKELEITVLNDFLFLFGIIVFYGLFYQFVAVRQGIAMVFGFAAVWFVLKNRWIISLLLVLVSATMHTAGIFNLVPIIIIYFTGNIGRKKYLAVWGIFFLMIVTGAENRLFYFTNLLVSRLSSLSAAYEGYGQSYYTNGGVVTIRVVYMLLVLLMTMVSVTENGYYKVLNVVYAGVIVMGLFGSWRIVQRLYDILFVFMAFSLYGVLADGGKVLWRRVKPLYPMAVILLCFGKVFYNFRVLAYI